MKFVRLFPLFLVSALVLAACGKDDSGEDSSTAGIKDSGHLAGNGLLAFVPENTPYFAGNLAPLPDDVVDSYLRRVEPMLATVQQEMAVLKLRIESDPETLESEPGARIVHAVLQELDGKLNRAGLESLGFDITPEQVMYGMSAFPVMRTSLANADALRATVQRVLDNANVEAPKLQFQGQDYWRFIPESHEYDENGDEVVDAGDSGPAKDAIGIYIAILPDHMVIGMLPVFAEDKVLPAFLAQEIPASSSAENSLKTINKRFDYTPFGTGVVEFQRLYDEIVDANSLAGQYISLSGHDLAELNSDICRQEISGMIAHTPRIFTGMSEFNETTLGSRTVVETESSLASELMGLVADVPVANPKTTFLAELALGLKIGPLRDFLRNKATAMVEQPYQCEALADINQKAQQAADQLNQPIPPMVNNLFGLRVALASINKQSPESAQGLIALHVTQPEMLVGMAQMLVPNLAELDLTVGAPPVQVPANMIPMPGLVIYAAQAKTSIGLSVGEGQQNELSGFINQEGKSNGTFLSANYDSAAFSDMTGQMGDDYEDNEALAQYEDFAARMQEEAQKLMDRSDTRLSFTKDGFVIDSTSTLKNP